MFRNEYLLASDVLQCETVPGNRCQRDTIANVHFWYSHENMKLHNANLSVSQKFIFPIIKLIAPYVKEKVSPFICARPWDLIPSTTKRSRGAKAFRLLRVS